MSEQCEVKRCRQVPALTYYKHRVCDGHWTKHCESDNQFNLKEEFNIGTA